MKKHTAKDATAIARAADRQDAPTAGEQEDSQSTNPALTAFDANAVRVAIEQNDAEINDNELSLISAISNLLTKNDDVPLDIAKPICPLYIHKLRMIGATFDVKKDAARDYAVASARDMFRLYMTLGKPILTATSMSLRRESFAGGGETGRDFVSLLLKTTEGAAP